jgi:hypothetical protein
MKQFLVVLAERPPQQMGIRAAEEQQLLVQDEAEQLLVVQAAGT